MKYILKIICEVKKVKFYNQMIEKGFLYWTAKLTSQNKITTKNKTKIAVKLYVPKHC